MKYILTLHNEEQSMHAIHSRLQKILLTAGAIGWGIAVLGVLLPWNWIAPMLQSMGATYDFSDRQVQYWLRMACGGWSVIGFLFLMVLLFPAKYRNVVPLLAIGTLFEGVVLLSWGMFLKLPLFPFAGDVGFCFVVGGGLLFTGTRLGQFSWPLLAGRTADASPWRLDGIEPSITAAYLEAISFAFGLDSAQELFRLRPDDSLFALYDSYYKCSRRKNRWGADNMELEECCGAFEALGRFSGTEFDCRNSLHEQLRTIAANRDNQPLTAEEIKSMRLTMRLLPYLTNKR